MVSHRGRNIYLLQVALADIPQGIRNTAMFIVSLTINRQESPNHKDKGNKRMKWKLRYVVVLFGNQGND